MNNPLISPGIGVFFWMLVSFGILVFILGKWAWPVMINALKKRETAIADSLNAAEKAREEMKQIKSGKEEELRLAKQERDEILHNARMTSEQIIEDARKKASDEIIRMRELRAMHDLKNQIATLSIDIAEKIIKAELVNTEAAKSLVNSELEKAEL